MRTIFYIILFGLSNSILFSQNDWIIQFDDINANKSFDTSLELLSPQLKAYRLKSQQSVSKDSVYRSLKKYGTIKYLFENRTIPYRMRIPDDELFFEQWNLNNIEVPRVWEETIGGSFINGEEAVIAIMDDGFDVSHEDLNSNIWTNAVEIPNDNIDNDGNGYIDDHMGLNIEDQNDVHPIESHGSRVTGIIGGVGDNGVGISGINWNAKILLMSNVSNVAEVIVASEYLYNLKDRYLKTGGAEGANIVVSNYSAGLRRTFPSELPTWCEVYDLLGSVGILSVGAVPNEDYDIEEEGDMPTLCESDYLIMVTNSDHEDNKVFEAAVDRTHVDLAAPGENIRSTELNGNYGFITGTSASTPHVAGAIGLLYTIPCLNLAQMAEQAPESTALLMKEAILSGVDKNETLKETVSGGRLNVYQALLRLGNVCGESSVGELELRNVSIREEMSKQSLELKIEYSTGIFTDHKLWVFDIMGNKFHESTFNPDVFGEKEITISLNGIPSGAYVVSIFDGMSSTSKLFLNVSH